MPSNEFNDKSAFGQQHEQLQLPIGQITQLTENTEEGKLSHTQERQVVLRRVAAQWRQTDRDKARLRDLVNDFAEELREWDGSGGKLHSLEDIQREMDEIINRLHG